MVLGTQGLQADELHGSETGTLRETRVVTLTMPFETQARPVPVEIVDGLAVYEGDIIVGRVNQFDLDSPVSGVAIDGANARWGSSLIPFVLPANHPQRADIQAAIRTVQLTTNLCMLPRTNQANFVQFVNNGGCSSFVGRRGGGQSINIGGNGTSCSRGSIVHEIFHAAGLFHEQSRSDRNRFVTINFANIQPGTEGNFGIANTATASDLGAYDYGSIMHYSRLAFSRNGLPTITVLTAGAVIGQRTAPSTRDVASINTLYPTRNNTAACVQARQ
jgi:astacin